MDKPRGGDQRTKYQDLAASSLGIEVAVATLLGGLLGWWLDGRYGTRPWFMLGLLVAGAVIGWIDVAVQVRAMDLRDMKDRKDKQKEDGD